MTLENKAAADVVANAVAEATSKMVRIDLSKIWSYSRLPDLQMHDPDPAKSAADAAAAAAKAAADAARSEEDEAESRRESRRTNPDLDPRLKRLAKDDPENFDYVYDLREGQNRFRKKYNAELAEKEALAAEVAKLKNAASEVERKKLEESQAHKELYEREAEGRKQTRTKLVDSKIEAQVARRGYTEEGEKRALKLIERRGIEVDADDNVSGIEKAFDRMEEEWGDEMFLPPARGTKAADGGDDDADKGKDKPNPKHKGDEPGDGESAADYRKRKALGNAGKEFPPAKSNAGGKKFDARDKKVTDEERAAKLAEIRGGR